MRSWLLLLSRPFHLSVFWTIMSTGVRDFVESNMLTGRVDHLQLGLTVSSIIKMSLITVESWFVFHIKIGFANHDPLFRIIAIVLWTETVWLV